MRSGERDHDAARRGLEDQPGRSIRMIRIRGLRLDDHGDAAGGGGQGEEIVQWPAAPDGPGASVDDDISIGRGRDVFMVRCAVVVSVFAGPLWTDRVRYQSAWIYIRCKLNQITAVRSHD